MSASWSRVTAALVIGTVVLSGLLLGPRPAAADTQPPVPATPVTVSTDPLPTVQINGVVWAQIVVGNTAGVVRFDDLTAVRPAAG